MKKVIFEKLKETICLNEITEDTPIFLVRNKIVKGLLMKDVNSDGDYKWIIRLGGRSGSTGYHETREMAMKTTLDCTSNSEFVIDPEIL